MRKEFDSYTIYNKKTGNRWQTKIGFFIGYYNTYDEVQNVYQKIDDPNAIICLREVYRYFDEKENFTHREEYIVPVDGS